MVNLAALGGVSVKGLFLEPREGHPPARIVETPSGMLNAIGLQGIGVRQFIKDKLPLLRNNNAVVIIIYSGGICAELNLVEGEPVSRKGLLKETGKGISE